MSVACFDNTFLNGTGISVLNATEFGLNLAANKTHLANIIVNRTSDVALAVSSTDFLHMEHISIFNSHSKNNGNLYLGYDIILTYIWICCLIACVRSLQCAARCRKHFLFSNGDQRKFGKNCWRRRVCCRRWRVRLGGTNVFERRLHRGGKQPGGLLWRQFCVVAGARRGVCAGNHHNCPSINQHRSDVGRLVWQCGFVCAQATLASAQCGLSAALVERVRRQREEIARSFVQCRNFFGSVCSRHFC